MKPMFGLHKNAVGEVISASSFNHNFQLNDWLRGLDIRDGDLVEFKETATRAEGPEVLPAFLETPPALPPTEKLMEDEQPF